MEETTKKWVTGCAIGCGLVVVIGCLLVLGSYLGVKKMIRAAKETKAGMDSVTERFGSAADFAPDPTGRVPPERIEAFLLVRELSSPERGRLEASLAQLSGTDTGSNQTVGRIVQSVQAGMGFLPQMMAYINSRNAAFLEANLGLGEYLYLYALIYESWLEKPVDDGPPFVLVGGEVESSGWSESDVRDRRAAEIRKRLNRTSLPMLQNQLAAATTAVPPMDPEWVESLRTEILLLESEPARLPWQDGLPPQTAASLDPFFEALDASYSPLCHPVELAVMQH